MEPLPFKTGSFSFLLYRGMNGDSERLIIFPGATGSWWWSVFQSWPAPQSLCPCWTLTPALSISLSLFLPVCLSLWSESCTDPNFKVAREYRLTWITHLLSLRVMAEEMERAGTQSSTRFVKDPQVCTLRFCSLFSLPPDLGNCPLNPSVLCL